MKEHPRLFAPGMVRAIVADRKTQTRRRLVRHNSLVDGATPTQAMWDALDWPSAAVDAGPSPAGNAGPYMQVRAKDGQTRHRVYPRVEVGDVFWVREAWRSLPQFDRVSPIFIPTETGVWYEADAKPAAWGRWGKLRPGMFMPRWASRLRLSIAAVRPQRLQDISEADAVAEGIERETVIVDAHCAGGFHQEVHGERFYAPGNETGHESGVDAYATLWDAINGAGEWDKNPLIWAYTFTRKAP